MNSWLVAAAAGHHLDPNSIQAQKCYWREATNRFVIELGKEPEQTSLMNPAHPLRHIFIVMVVCCLAIPRETFSHEGLRISWTNNLLTITSPNLPGGKLDIWYLEAFCRKGAHNQDWNKTTIPHKTTLLKSDPDGRELKLRTTIGEVEMIHVLRADADNIDIQYHLVNQGSEASPIEWFEPACMRVDRFTGCQQSNYTGKSFIFTERGLTTLDKTRRTEDALYRGGQVYIPNGIDLADANPRPLCSDVPINGLIGCFSADDKYLLATAFDSTHELFEGVYVCLHSDPHVGGLKPGETREIHGKIYFLKNDVPALLRRYRSDFRVRAGTQ